MATVCRALLLLVGVSALLLGGAQAQNASAIPGGFIRVSGQKFVDENCKEFPYISGNVWQLLEASAGIVTPKDTSYLGGLTPVQYLFEKAKANGVTIIRAFGHGFYDKYIMLQPKQGQYDEKAFVALDRIISEAANKGVRLILTFIDNWFFPDGKYQYALWANPAAAPEDFFTDSKAKDFYKAHVSTMVNRVNTISGKKYRDDPAIFGWNLINEARGDCNVSAPNISCTNPEVPTKKIQAWIEEMSGYVKSLDPNHLLTVGTEGFYPANSPSVVVNPLGRAEAWSGKTGQDFINNCRPAAIDYCAIHGWVDNWGVNGTVDKGVAFLGKWIDQHAVDAASIGKLLVMEEFGKSVKYIGDSSSIDTLRNPYYKAVFDRYAGALNGGGNSSNFKGVGFWQMGFLGPLQTDYETVNFADSTFSSIIAPIAKLGGAAAGSTVSGCTPGQKPAVSAGSIALAASPSPAVANSPAPAVAASPTTSPASPASPASSPSPSPPSTTSSGTCQSATTLNKFEQCGGLNTNGNFQGVDGPFPCTKCADGSACVRGSQYYYQCNNPPAGLAAPVPAPRVQQFSSDSGRRLLQGN